MEMKWLQRLLGIDKLNERIDVQNTRIEEIARHFVTKHDPATGQAIETLADRHADQDGKPRPGLIKRSRNWDQNRRFLEQQDAGKAMTKVRPV